MAEIPSPAALFRRNPRAEIRQAIERAQSFSYRPAKQTHAAVRSKPERSTDREGFATRTSTAVPWTSFVMQKFPGQLQRAVQGNPHAETEQRPMAAAA
ncbi:hypothetical protein N6L27_01440 [Leisingera sp. SS27]|uniref:hypothetical protein n=1 Tax=Leisingera sp. SS27 TaxID=2979462 RepID=UPI00232AADC8|nr:hypothetical protein [Leisingera sp. SS27]MDC0656657.1 hypothetical protein [Leisingera sp. SS27]